MVQRPALTGLQLDVEAAPGHAPGHAPAADADRHGRAHVEREQRPARAADAQLARGADLGEEREAPVGAGADPGDQAPGGPIGRGRRDRRASGQAGRGCRDRRAAGQAGRGRGDRREAGCGGHEEALVDRQRRDRERAARGGVGDAAADAHADAVADRRRPRRGGCRARTTRSPRGGRRPAAAERSGVAARSRRGRLAIVAALGPCTVVRLPAASSTWTAITWRPSATCRVSSATVAPAAAGQGARWVNSRRGPGSRSRQRSSPTGTDASSRPSTSSTARWTPPPRSDAAKESAATPASGPGPARSPRTAETCGAEASCSVTCEARTCRVGWPGHALGPPHCSRAVSALAPSPNAETADQPRSTDGTSVATYRSRPPTAAANSVFQSPGHEAGHRPLEGPCGDRRAVRSVVDPLGELAGREPVARPERGGQPAGAAAGRDEPAAVDDARRPAVGARRRAGERVVLVRARGGRGGGRRESREREDEGELAHAVLEGGGAKARPAHRSTAALKEAGSNPRSLGARGVERYGGSPTSLPSRGSSRRGAARVSRRPTGATERPSSARGSAASPRCARAPRPRSGA